jgi:hypothetical protein
MVGRDLAEVPGKFIRVREGDQVEFRLLNQFSHSNIITVLDAEGEIVHQQFG